MKNIKDKLINEAYGFDENIIWLPKTALEAIDKFMKSNKISKDGIEIRSVHNDDDMWTELYAIDWNDIPEETPNHKWPWKKIWKEEENDEKILI